MHHGKEGAFFMLQIKLVPGETIDSLNEAVNAFLANYKEDAIKDINVDTEKMIATIQYITSEEWKGEMCCDCRFWDDGDSEDSLVGLCQIRGGRKRFSNKACECWKDVRG